MTQVDTFQQQILNKLNKIAGDVNAFKIATLEVNTKVEAYQKSSTQVTNLAFALISVATVTVIVS